jgi:DNA modification methylase
MTAILQLDVQHIPLPDQTIDMIFSDPPYVKRLLHTYQWLAEEAARVLKPGRFVAVMCGGMGLNKLMRWFDDAGLTFYWLYQLQMTATGAGIVWMHGSPNIPIATRIKHILVYSNGPALARTATVSPYRAGAKDKRWHPWGQDVDSHRYYIDCFSHPGDLVLDPMVGGGTTAAACAAIGRRYIAGDLRPGCCLTTKRRMNGKPAQ